MAAIKLPASIGAVTTATIVVAISIISVRILNIVRCIHNNRRKRRRSKERGDDHISSSSMDHLRHNDDETQPSTSSKIKTVVFLGSGGHTTEMIQLLQELDPKIYAPIVYIVAKSDVTSIPRLQRYILSSGMRDGKDCHPQWEGRYPKSINKTSGNDDVTTTTSPPAQAQVYTLPRAREVHQSYLSSIFTTLHSTYKTAQLLWKIQPHLIVTNGPGTCVPIVYCAFILRCLFSFLHLFRFGKDSSLSSSEITFRTIFIESLCRVKTISLSGKLVYPIVDSFVVHWPSLMEQYEMVEICDVLVPSLES